MKKSVKIMASILFFGIFVLSAIGSGEDENKEVKTTQEDNLNLISEDKIANKGTKTFKSGFYYLQFKDDHTVYIYQSSGGAARGCTAEGIWKIENSMLNIKVNVSHCGTRDYNELNGKYTYSAFRKKSNNDLIETIKSSSQSFYHGY